MRIGAKVNKDKKQNAKDSIGEESNLLTQVIWNKAQDQGGFEKMRILIQWFMDSILTTGGKRRTIMSLGSNLWTDSLFEKNHVLSQLKRYVWDWYSKSNVGLRETKFANDDVSNLMDEILISI